MNNWQTGLLFLIWLGFIGFFWWRRAQYKKRIVAQGRAAEYERARTKITRIFYPLIGIVVIGMIVRDWPTLPPESKLLALFIGALGLAALLYGLTRWRTLR